MIIDNFAGGGGASVGIKMALGRQVDIKPTMHGCLKAKKNIECDGRMRH